VNNFLSLFSLFLNNSKVLIDVKTYTPVFRNYSSQRPEHKNPIAEIVAEKGDWNGNDENDIGPELGVKI